MQRPQATSGQGESLVRLKLQPHFFATSYWAGRNSLAKGGRAWVSHSEGSCPWALGTCQGLCTTELVPPPCSHIPATWAANS